MGDWNAGMVLKWEPNFYPSVARGKAHMRQGPRLSAPNNKKFITHCSYCFETMEEYLQKLKSFTHQEFNRPPFTTNDWLFKSHFCRMNVNNPNGHDEPETDWSQLIPNDPRFRFLWDPAYEFDITKTNYTKEDLKTLCKQKFRRVWY